MYSRNAIFLKKGRQHGCLFQRRCNILNAVNLLLFPYDSNSILLSAVRLAFCYHIANHFYHPLFCFPRNFRAARPSFLYIFISTIMLCRAQASCSPVDRLSHSFYAQTPYVFVDFSRTKDKIITADALTSAVIDYSAKDCSIKLHASSMQPAQERRTLPSVTPFSSRHR